MSTSEPVAILPKSDPRIARSELAIQQALLTQLAAGREFASLTVSEIADQAGVTRKTFYARYGTLEQVVRRLLMDLFLLIASRVDDQMLRIPLQDNSLAMLVFSVYEEHQTILTPLVRQCPTNLFIEPATTVVAQLLDRVIEVNQATPMREVDRAYLVATVASMVHAVLAVWVQRNFIEPPEQVAEFVDTLLARGMQVLLLSNPTVSH